METFSTEKMENPLSKSPIMPFHAIVTKIDVYKKFAKFVTKIMVTKFIVNQINSP